MMIAFTSTERDHLFYGLGVCNMKGFFARAMEAARDYLNTPLKAPLIILATADEESSMNGARALVAIGKSVDSATLCRGFSTGC